VRNGLAECSQESEREKDQPNGGRPGFHGFGGCNKRKLVVEVKFWRTGILPKMILPTMILPFFTRDGSRPAAKSFRNVVNRQVGRVTPCAPFEGPFTVDGADGVTRPTCCGTKKIRGWKSFLTRRRVLLASRPVIPLEDNFVDVIGKAQRGLKLNDDQLA